MTFVIALVVRPTALLVAGLLLVACLTKRSAALRHCVLVGSIVAASLAAPLSLVLPEFHVALPSVTMGAASEAGTSGVVTSTLASTVAAGAERPAHSSPLLPLAIIWAIGVGVAGANLLTGLTRVRSVARRATAVKDERWIRQLELVGARYGLTRSIVLSRTDASDLLATIGLRRPQILLPSHSHGWTVERINVVLSHELAHVRRCDWIVQMAAEALRVMLWFNPLAWMVCTRLRREAEHACDDEVLRSGVSGRAYAEQLLVLARQCRRPPAHWAAAVPMAQPSALERRIAAMLNPGLDRQTPSRRTIAALVLALALITIPVAALRARQATPAPLAGTIYDVSGAVLPGVQVVLVDASQTTSVAITNASGRFQFAAVAPGRYALEAALPGFRQLRNEFELSTPRDWSRVFTLQLGDLKESVRVRESRAATSPRPAPLPPRVVRVGGNIRAPRKEVDVRPEYPAAMRDAGLTGTVSVEATIGRDGSVTSVRVLNAEVHPDFAIAAVDAVRQWRFSPTLLNGVPVEVVMAVSVQFDLE